MEVWERYTMFLIANYHKDLMRYAEAMGASDGRKFYVVNHPSDLHDTDGQCVLFLCGDVSHRIDYLELQGAIDYHKHNGLKVIQLDEHRLFLNIPNPPDDLKATDYDDWYREQRMERRKKQYAYVMDVLNEVID